MCSGVILVLEATTQADAQALVASGPSIPCVLMSLKVEALRNTAEDAGQRNS